MIEIFDSILKLSEKSQILDNIQSKKRQISELPTICGSCALWMTIQCNREKTRKVSCNMSACSDFKYEKWVSDLISKLENEVYDLEVSLNTYNTNNVLADVTFNLCDAIEKSDVKVTFGLHPKHLEKIETELKRWDEMIKEGGYLKTGWRKYDKFFWDKLGKEVGWCPITLALYYFEYLDNLQSL